MTLRVKMSGAPVWARVHRPRIPLVYLDLNHVIGIARARTSHPTGTVEYAELYAAALRAKREQRATFPLSGSHLWEVSKITDPRQRRDLADVLESLSDFNYLLGRSVVAQLELEAAIDHAVGEDSPDTYLPLLRPTFGQVFGYVGGIKFRDAHDRDTTSEVRAAHGPEEFDELMRTMNLDLERRILRGPTDEEAAELRRLHGFQPEVAHREHGSRLEWELETTAQLARNPEWRRNGRLQDLVGAREFTHEWLNALNRVQEERHEAGRTSFDPNDDDMRSILGNLPQHRVAVALKTRFHQNPNHRWRTNTITDIDAAAVAYSYCDAMLTDKEVRAGLAEAKDLRGFGTYLPRSASELAGWLDDQPAVIAPELLIPHPPRRAPSR